MAYSESKSPEKVIGQLKAKANTNREIKKTSYHPNFRLVDMAKANDEGTALFGPAIEEFLSMNKVRGLRKAQITPGKGTSMKQLADKGGKFSNLSPDEEKLMTRAENAKMKAAAIAKSKAKIGKK